MTTVKQLARCPYCKETVVAGASKCKHCLSELTPPKRKNSALKSLNTFRTGFLTGILFSLILSILIYLQFYAAR